MGDTVGSGGNGGPPLRQLMAPFAAAVFAKAAAHRSLRAFLTPAQARRLLESIAQDVRKATDLHPHEVSEAAAEVARGLRIDLGAKTWHDQPKFDPKRKTFIVEHMVPVSALANSCTRQPDVDAVLQILIDGPRVVWLLRREDEELTRRGFHHDRPDPEEAYRLAGIKLVKRPNGGGRGDAS